MRKSLNLGSVCSGHAYWLAGMLLIGAASVPALASEHVTLTNGMEMFCDHQERVGDRVRLYMTAGSPGFVEFPMADVASVEPGPASAPAVVEKVDAAAEPVLTEAELQEMLARAGAQHNLDVDLLASVIHAESGGNVHAVSRAGAQGLMQLMPKTAKELGVADSFHPQENINGGTAYLDSLLTKYHDKLALALAAYNAGPAAVDRWHGVPPYRETRAYVARVIREFNRAALARKRDAKHVVAQVAAKAAAGPSRRAASAPTTAPAANAAQGNVKLAAVASKAATQLAMAEHSRSLQVQ